MYEKWWKPPKRFNLSLIVVRTHKEDESKFLREENIGKVFYGEEELANGMCESIVEQYAPK